MRNKKNRSLKIKLENIASIKSGIFAKTGPLGNLLYLQANSFDENRILDPSSEPTIRLKDINPKHILQNNDILLVARGDYYPAFLYENNEAGAIASPTFLVIRVINYQINPAYLVWYLNTPTIQRQLARESKGSAIQSITKKAINELIVPIPSLETQKTIVEIDTLARRQTALLIKIAEEKSKRIGQEIFNYLRNKI